MNDIMHQLEVCAEFNEGKDGHHEDGEATDLSDEAHNSQDTIGLRPILHLPMAEDETAEYKPSIVLISPPPSWAKRFASKIVAPAGDEKWKISQPSLKGSAGEFISLQLSDEEKQTANAEMIAINNMLATIREKVEEKSDSCEGNASSCSSVDDSSQGQVESASSQTETAHREVERPHSDAQPSENCVEASVEENVSIPNEGDHCTDMAYQEEEGIITDEDSQNDKTEHHGDLRNKINSKKHEVNILKRKNLSYPDYGDIKLTKYSKLFTDQIHMVSVTDELNQMRKNNISTDCEVKVGKTTYHCHSLILKRGGSYFENVLREEGAYFVEIEDITPEAFELILDYLYLGKVNLKSFGEARQVLAASLELKLPELVKTCTRFCTQQLQGDQPNFWPVLDSLLKDQPEPYQLSLSQISEFDKLLGSKDFLKTDINTLKFIVEQKFLVRCSESILIESAEEWAKYHLEDSNITVNAENLRLILGVAFGKLRYFSLAQIELCALFKKTQLLTESEKLYLLEWSVTRHGNPVSKSMGTIKSSRSRPINFRLPKFPREFDLMVHKHEKVNCSFFFTPTTDMLLLTFDFFSRIRSPRARKAYQENFTAQILLVEGNRIEILREVQWGHEVDYDSIIRVKLPVPVVLRQSSQHSYAIKLTLGCAGRYKIVGNNLTLFMQNSKLKPIKSDWCYGNHGIFSAICYKVLV